MIANYEKQFHVYHFRVAPYGFCGFCGLYWEVVFGPHFERLLWLLCSMASLASVAFVTFVASVASAAFGASVASVVYVASVASVAFIGRSCSFRILIGFCGF